ncbi:acyl carrier protein [Nocardioides luteus]|uniref:Acyl carrier protein n=1 Tax=Nocardioides luteus TaxID=1844 RepID=A0ABQ5SUZ7_9ACTN|nr:acyl carrier protein [Nocardioides luteus]MDR7309236.1 acyl carrier protein [Nocardioides luteus]GGR48882.1 acyl carrier protein [Nocardioides luteus]GLJ67641.1 acyl carrier protein [Nocardioides luteus]
MADLQRTIEAFILDSLLLGDEERLPAPTDSLVESGVIDSTGILELIEFLEAEFEITVTEAETVPDNLDGVANLVAYVARKTAADSLAG